MLPFGRKSRDFGKVLGEQELGRLAVGEQALVKSGEARDQAVEFCPGPAAKLLANLTFFLPEDAKLRFLTFAQLIKIAAWTELCGDLRQLRRAPFEREQKPNGIEPKLFHPLEFAR